MATPGVNTPSPSVVAGHHPASSSSSKVNQETKNAKALADLKRSLVTIERVPFDADKHLAYMPPSKTYSMKELGYSEGAGLSPIGVSEPFPLFSTEAIQQMRAEILSDDVWKQYQFNSDLAQCQLRGFAAECAPFVYDAWKSPETLKIISKIAGIDLVPAMDWEIGHVNISVQSEDQKNQALADVTEKVNREEDEGVCGCPWEDEKPIVDWHTDSYPFVCVIMLSDCTNMIGGETALRKGNGDIVKVRGPQMGCAVVLQGRYIEHQALRALGATERITMVTSFRPRSSILPDDTVLTTVRPVSDLSELYFQFSEYRLEMLEERIRVYLKEMREKKRARRPLNTPDIKRFIAEQEEFLAHMNQEIIDDDKVKKGITDDSHLVSEDLKQRSRKRALVRLD